MTTNDIWNEEQSMPNPIDSLSREIRQQLADEIESLPEFDPDAHPGRAGRPLSTRDAERIVGMLQDTLREVSDRGGFIRDLPRRQAKIKKLREKIQTSKEDLSEMCEEMVSKLRALRWMGVSGTGQGPRPRTQKEGPPVATDSRNRESEYGMSELEQVQTELKNLRAQCRRQCEVLLSTIHELALEEEHCERLESAATHREKGEGDSSRISLRHTKGSPMVFRRKNSRIV